MEQKANRDNNNILLVLMGILRLFFLFYIVELGNFILNGILTPFPNDLEVFAEEGFPSLPFRIFSTVIIPYHLKKAYDEMRNNSRVNFKPLQAFTIIISLILLFSSIIGFIRNEYVYYPRLFTLIIVLLILTYEDINNFLKKKIPTASNQDQT